jgi:hypothetical protein
LYNYWNIPEIVILFTSILILKITRKYFMQKLILSILALFIMNSCYGPKVLFHGTSELFAQSEPIYLVHSNMESSSFYFIINRHFKDDAQDYNILVRWRSDDSKGNFASKKDNNLKFLIDNSELMSLEQISKPKIIGIDFDSGKTEDECVFKVTRQQLERLASAKRVRAELVGRERIVAAKFSRFVTFRLFKQFLRQS